MVKVAFLPFAEKVVVRGNFGRKQKNSKKRKSELEGFRSPLSLGNWLQAPGRCRATSQAPDPPESQEIQNRPKQSENHHGDPNRVNVHTVGKLQCAGGRCKCPNADEEPDAAERHERAANALQNRKEQTGPVDDRDVEWQRTCAFRGFICLSHLCGVLGLF
ncbi:MAG TPA: hypothetical protein VMH48_11450 [Methylomirabilota bacterium]|nr:hypothetical protein [Methylomirabilota bacterium]